MNDITREFNSMCFQVLGGPVGKRFMRLLKEFLDVERTIEPEEEDGRPICPISMGIRKGRRDVYYLLKNHAKLGESMIEEINSGT